MRRSHDRKNGLGPMHIVSAWASAPGITLGQVLSQPGFVQLRPSRNRGGAIGGRHHGTDGNHDDVTQSMQPIDSRPRVGCQSRSEREPLSW